MNHAEQMEQVITLLSKAADALRGFANVADLCRGTLTESKRAGEAIRAHRIPGNFQEFLDAVRETEPTFLPFIEGAHVDRFDTGRLWLTISDGLARSTVETVKPMFQGILQDLYGMAFAIRVRAPKKSEPEEIFSE